MIRFFNFEAIFNLIGGRGVGFFVLSILHSSCSRDDSILLEILVVSV